ncbi:MAG TPA: endolytic transglycosylase MltG, partial [Candidatus Paceibacterota bacterium]|nr:endolytic transglycosylase MltG [Candidatus Paceibacterota bacterium]
MTNRLYWFRFTLLAIFVVALVFVSTYYLGGFGAAGDSTETERFVVSKGMSNLDVVKKLKTDDFIISEWAFNFAFNWEKFGWQIKPGAYKISKSMTAWQMAGVFTNEPYMKWVTIPEGLRKEEVAVILKNELGWSDEKASNWIAKDTAASPDYTEGVYFPETYLIPVEESGADVAKRLRVKFEEKYSEFYTQALG